MSLVQALSEKLDTDEARQEFLARYGNDVWEAFHEERRAAMEPDAEPESESEPAGANRSEMSDAEKSAFIGEHGQEAYLDLPQ